MFLCKTHNLGQFHKFKANWPTFWNLVLGKILARKDSNKGDQLTVLLECKGEHRPPDKSAEQKIIFLISQPKHMLLVLKRTISMQQFF